MAPADVAGSFSVCVAYAPSPRVVDLRVVQVAAGCTVEQALRASGLLEHHGLRLGSDMMVGVWARLKPLDHVLREGDRVEVYRPLRVDPKEARRQRYRRSGERGRARTRTSEGSG